MKSLKMPANYVAVSEQEQLDVCGGGVLAQVCHGLGTMFSINYTNSQSEITDLEQKHGKVVSVNNNVYTYKDGFTYSMESTIIVSYNIGNFFFGLSEIFAAFRL